MIASLEKIKIQREQKIHSNNYGAICAVEENGKVILDGIEYEPSKIIKFDAVNNYGEGFALISCGNRNYFAAKLTKEGFLMKN